MMRALPGQLLASLRTFVVLSLLLGIAYPLLVMGVSQVAFKDNANGSLVKRDGQVVGSDLIGQAFSDADGAPIAKYFQPRASAAGDGYDPTGTAASNRGPEDTEDTPDDPATTDDDSRTSLLTSICTRSKEVGAANNVSGARKYCTADGVGAPSAVQGASSSAAAVPPDAVTASGSGLDPHISPAYARLQVARVAQARGLQVEQVRALVDKAVQGRTLGFLGEPRVNVLKLNLALDRLG
jgi:potassium-transporting ATPase KdpC subunit